MSKSTAKPPVSAGDDIDQGPFHVRCADGRQGNASFDAAPAAVTDARRRNLREVAIGGEADAEWFVAVSIEKDRVGWRRAVLAEG